jgi:hypothetical protein
MTTLHRQHIHRNRRERCSNHAGIRMQQRRIPRAAIDLLLTYGDEKRTDSGYIRHFTQRARCRLGLALPNSILRSVARYLDCYLIESDDGIIVTVGHRYKRIRSRG